MNKKTTWITRSAVLTALLVALQMLTASFGNQLLTGSVVNMVLIVSVMICGLGVGLTVSAVSPIFAKLIGIGPFWQLIPFIMLGNMILVVAWHIIGNKEFKVKRLEYVFAAVVGAVLKFVFLLLTISKFAVPIILQLPEPKASVIGNIFSYPQLFTALIGGAIAIIILPILKKAIKNKN